MMSLRSKFLGGSLIVLTEQGNPVTEPSPNGTTTFTGDTWNVYAARRQGNGTKSGAILVINNNDTYTRGIWVDNDGSPNGTATAGYTDWKNQVLVNILNPSQTTTVAADGRVHLYAPARGYAVWVLQSENMALRTANPNPVKEVVTETKVYPNPSASQVNIEFSTAENEKVVLEIYDASGRLVNILTNNVLEEGRHKKLFTAKNAGVYTYKLKRGEKTETGQILITK